jgi:hypothetical protein
LSSATGLLALQIYTLRELFISHWTHWSGLDRLYKPARQQTSVKKQACIKIGMYQKRGDNMDLTTNTIKRLFEQQIRDLTMRTTMTKEESFDYQFGGGWLQ